MQKDFETIKVVRDLEPELLEPLDDEEASVTDGMLLNHMYVDMRGCDMCDLAHAIADETEFLQEAEKLRHDPKILGDLMDSFLEQTELDFDLGVNAAVIALSVVGAAPISSCNGGWFGDWHSSSVPHILFSIAPCDVGVVLEAAEVANCGIINNGRHAEIYADKLPKLLDFAREVQKRVEPISLC